MTTSDNVNTVNYFSNKVSTVESICDIVSTVSYLCDNDNSGCHILSTKHIAT